MARPPAPPTVHRTSLEVRGLGKRFGRTLALAGVDVDVRQGEVHALLGHNGSGKSTLVKIISGVEAADEGTVTINGRDGAPAQIGVVHQDLGLCLDATVVENCCMSGYRTTRFATIHWSAERRAVHQILESLAADFDGEAMVRDLSPANQAVVAIARALKSAPVGGALDLLVIDEATSRLRGRDADKVLATASMVARQGGGVLIVTHHMTEVLRAADRATVLANGRVAGVVNVADTTEEGLLELASGHQVAVSRSSSPAAGRRPARDGHTTPDRRSAGEPVLVASDLAGDRILSRAGITLAAGEIVGLTGAPGAGHEEIPYLIAGLAGRGRAEIVVSGHSLRRRGAGAGRRRGIGLVPADRLAQGVLPTASIRENLSPLVRRRHTRSRLTSNRRELAWAREVCRSFRVRPDEPEVPIGDLSGGNQQKVLLARVLEDEPAVLLLHEPTEGVDEMTRRALLDVVRQAAERGTAVLYVSSDIEEVAGCADRVLVVRDGALVAESAGGPEMVDEIYAACYLTRDATAAGTAGTDDQ